MRRTLWLIVFAAAWSSLAGGIGEGLAASTTPPPASQQVAGGGVTVIATLLTDQADMTAVTLAIETHSVNLDGYAFEKIAILRDDSGKRYPVEAVEQASGGGHHREAVLRFAKRRPEAKTLELIVTDVAGVKERTFRWTLSK